MCSSSPLKPRSSFKLLVSEPFDRFHFYFVDSNLESTFEAGHCLAQVFHQQMLEIRLERRIGDFRTAQVRRAFHLDSQLGSEFGFFFLLWSTNRGFEDSLNLEFLNRSKGLTEDEQNNK
jgi:hypothetical protein